MACRFPGNASTPAAYWRMLCAGTDAIVETPPERWNVDAFYDQDPTTPAKTNTRWAGHIDQVDQFDAGFFGISPREAAAMDPQQRILLEVAWEALEDAGQSEASLAGSRTGVFVGICSSDYGVLQSVDLHDIDIYSGIGSDFNIVAGRLAYLLDLRGPLLLAGGAAPGLPAVAPGRVRPGHRGRGEPAAYAPVGHYDLENAPARPRWALQDV
jgi:myxalamid-type polyketide synthase MxaE and MxaD